MTTVRLLLNLQHESVARDVKGVHSDVQMLLKTGVLDKNGAGKISFGYDAIHVDFMLKAA